MDVFDERVQFNSGGIALRGQLCYPTSGKPALAALLLGAHPLLGGDANNNVLHALREGLAGRGMTTFSFDYRGTGGSDAGGLDWERMIGDFWRDNRVPEESLWIADARAAFEWLRAAVDAPRALIGYSFGCRVLAELAASCAAQALVCVSPNPAQHDLSRIEDARVPLLVLSSDNDFSCPFHVLEDWFNAVRPPKERRLIAGAEHFFRGREQEVVEAVSSFLADCAAKHGAS